MSNDFKKTYTNVRHNKEETRVGKNAKIIEEQRNARFVIKKFNNKNDEAKGKYSFETAVNVQYDKIVYFDIETLEVLQKWVSINDKLFNTTDNGLNVTSKNPLKQFCALIPKSAYFRTRIDKIKAKFESYEVKNENDEKRPHEYLRLDEFDEYITFTYYNTDSDICLEVLFELFFDYLSNTQTKLYILGFNSNRFDSLIFNHLTEIKNFELFLNVVDRKITLSLNNTRKKNIDIIDIISMCKSFGLNNLEAVGQYLDFEKLSHDNELEKDEFIKYNIRDCEILYKFVKKLNEDFGIFNANYSKYVRNETFRYLFSKLPDSVRYINTSANIQNYSLRGAKTEPYNCICHDVYEVDVNSLYASSKLIDCIIPTIYEKKASYEMKKTDNHVNFIDNINRMEKDILEIDFKNEWQSMNKHLGIYKKYYPKTGFMGKFKIKGIKKDYSLAFQENLKKFFPFVKLKSGRACFQLFENEIYEIGFFEVIYLSFFDYEIIELNHFNIGKDIFHDYVKETYQKRQEEKEKGNLGIEKKFKAELNIGYGILATKNQQTLKVSNKKILETYKDVSNEELKNKTFIDGRSRIFGMKKKGDELYEIKTSSQTWIERSIPIYAMNIVSNARFYMYSNFFINAVFEVRPNLEIHYTDTDSIYCNVNMYKLIDDMGLIGKGLGLCSSEYDKPIKRAVFLAPKTYILEFEDGTIHKKFKGGLDWDTRILNQSLKQEFKTQTRVAIDPTKDQKRTLKNNKFINRIGTSQELVDVVAEAQTRYKKFAKVIETELN